MSLPSPWERAVPGAPRLGPAAPRPQHDGSAGGGDSAEQHGPFKSGAAMICLVLGLFAGLFHSGMERDGTPGPGSEDQGLPLPLCLRAKGPPFPGRDPAAEGQGPPVPVPSAPDGHGQDGPALLCGNLGTPPVSPRLRACEPRCPLGWRPTGVPFPPQSSALSPQPSAGSMNEPSWPSNQTGSSGAWSGRSSGASRGRGCSWWG